MVDRLLTSEEYTELKKAVKMQLEVDGHEVFVTDVHVEDDGKLKVAFFCKDEFMEDELSPHVHDCIKLLIEQEQKKEPPVKKSGFFSFLRG